ncbi:MAG: hypothetical protein HUK28_02895 [Methanobrevibacter sp.]|nr:hypothetical protein [Methanobrevibacter sp.]
MKKKYVALIVIIIIVVLCCIVALSSGGQSSKSDAPELQVQIICNGSWSGSIGVDGSSSSYDGTGNKTITLNGNSTDTVSANIQQDGAGQLTVKIIKDGKVVKEQSTNSKHGGVSITD